MDLKQIKLIIDLMKRSDLTEFSVEEEGFKLKICRSNTAPASGTLAPMGTSHPFQATQELGSQNPGQAPLAASTQASASGDEVGVGYVKSPMVGTFYRSPSPESKAFVDLGSKIADNSVVCIIEAMKIMNEIQAEIKGTILEILAENGQPVEYGQKLFKVKLG